MRIVTRHHLALLLVLVPLGIVAPTGCNKGDRAVAVPDAPLGRVIIYRNGVAYFERNATVEGELVLSVPGDRVDDFLKSLTVVDVATGESLPLSYPTDAPRYQHDVTMRIALPKGRRDVRIAYVTESPAWKPSYRVILDGSGTARLQSWAVVDNVSREAWRKVAVGVGSTSALSFRYDLHSVQTVERETIDTGVKLASAPPVGGSPYAVDGANVRVLAELSDDVLGNLDAVQGISLAGATAADASYSVDGGGSSVRRNRKARREARKAARTGPGRDFSQVVDGGTAAFAVTPEAAARETPPPAPPGIDEVAAKLAGNNQRVTVEGWAREGDADPGGAGLRRANALRDGLVARGVPPDRIDVVGHAEVASADKLVKVIANQDTRPTQSPYADVGDAPRGIAHFMTTSPMTIEAGHSAMVTLFDRSTAGERVFLYDPVSERGSKRYAFNAVRVVNPTDDTLESGPMTVYGTGGEEGARRGAPPKSTSRGAAPPAQSQFLGEGLADAIPPHAAAIVPYGLDRTLVATPTTATHEEIQSLSKVERGIATTQTQRIRRTTIELVNRGTDDARVYVRHHVDEGWELRDPPESLERLGDDIVVPIAVPAGKTVSLALVEATPITMSLDLRSGAGLRAVAVFLERKDIDPGLRASLQAIVDAHHTVADYEQILAHRRGQADALRERVDELSEQLVALRKVGRAQALSGHLAKRMRATGDRYDAVAAEISDLESKRLESGIALDNLVADLELEAPKVGRK